MWAHLLDPEDELFLVDSVYVLRRLSDFPINPIIVRNLFCRLCNDVIISSMINEIDFFFLFLIFLGIIRSYELSGAGEGKRLVLLPIHLSGLTCLIKRKSASTSTSTPIGTACPTISSRVRWAYQRGEHEAGHTKTSRAAFGGYK